MESYANILLQFSFDREKENENKYEASSIDLSIDENDSKNVLMDAMNNKNEKEKKRAYENLICYEILDENDPEKENDVNENVEESEKCLTDNISPVTEKIASSTTHLLNKEFSTSLSYVKKNNTKLDCLSNTIKHIENYGTGCRCKRTQCLKLYCKCFASGSLCSIGCNCLGCHNVDARSLPRQKAIQLVLSNKPKAFLKSNNPDMRNEMPKTKQLKMESFLSQYKRRKYSIYPDKKNNKLFDSTKPRKTVLIDKDIAPDSVASSITDSNIVD